MRKTLGISGLLLSVCMLTSFLNPDFLSPYNLQNTLRWTSLFGIISLGVSFVIMTGGIDLSIGSVVGLTGSILPMLLVEHAFSTSGALVVVIAVSLSIGLLHGLLITRLKLQPFVVTLCGLLIYRGCARYVTGDQVHGFGSGFGGLKQLTSGKPCTLAMLAFGIGSILSIWLLLRLVRASRNPDPELGRLGLLPGLVGSGTLAVLGAIVWLGEIKPVSEILVPMPFFIMMGLAVVAGIFLNHTIYGRYLLAVGRNEQAARYSGINTDGIVMMAYVICSLLAGIGGVLFALDINSIQPSNHGNFYELYAIAAAVLGGCSLRGGEGSILGVVIGAAVMRVLYNSINLLGIPTQLEFAIIGGVILIGVVVDELVKRLVARSRARRQLQQV